MIPVVVGDFFVVVFGDFVVVVVGDFFVVVVGETSFVPMYGSLVLISKAHAWFRCSLLLYGVKGGHTPFCNHNGRLNVWFR